MAGSELWLQASDQGGGGRGLRWPHGCSHLFLRVRTPPVPCDRGLWVTCSPCRMTDFRGRRPTPTPDPMCAGGPG